MASNIRPNPNALKNIGLYFVTDSRLGNLRPLQQVELAIKSGVKIVQYNEKELDRKQIHETAAKIRAITRKAGVLFIVNDSIDVAIKAEADGVHLSKTEIPLEIARKIMPKEMILGATALNIGQAIDAEKKGADYVSFGPVFTSRDAAVAPHGIEALNDIVSRLKIPVFAFGGISKENVKQVIKSNASGFIVVRELLAKDLENAISLFVKAAKHNKDKGRQ